MSKYHIRSAGVVSSVGICIKATNNYICKAVSVHVTCATHRPSHKVAHNSPAKHPYARMVSRGKVSHINVGDSFAAEYDKYDATSILLRCAHNDVVQTVAIYIARATDRATKVIETIISRQAKSGNVGSDEGTNLDIRKVLITTVAKKHVRATSVETIKRIGQWCANYEVTITIAVEITDLAYRCTKRIPDNSTNYAEASI